MDKRSSFKFTLYNFDNEKFFSNFEKTHIYFFILFLFIFYLFLGTFYKRVPHFVHFPHFVLFLEATSKGRVCNDTRADQKKSKSVVNNKQKRSTPPVNYGKAVAKFRLSLYRTHQKNTQVDSPGHFSQEPQFSRFYLLSRIRQWASKISLYYAANFEWSVATPFAGQ